MEASTFEISTSSARVNGGFFGLTAPITPWRSRNRHAKVRKLFVDDGLSPGRCTYPHLQVAQLRLVIVC